MLVEFLIMSALIPSYASSAESSSLRLAINQTLGVLDLLNVQSRASPKAGANQLRESSDNDSTPLLDTMAGAATEMAETALKNERNWNKFKTVDAPATMLRPRTAGNQEMNLKYFVICWGDVLDS